MKMKTFFVAVALTVTVASCDTIAKIAGSLGMTELEMAMGLKQALEKGLFKSFDEYQNPANNPLIAFVLPGEGQKIINTLNNLGLGSLVNQVMGKFNNATAQAFQTAKPIFRNALNNMSIIDAAKILVTRNQRAATDYFKANTQQDLIVAFRPIADSTIKTNGADREWKTIATAINTLPLGNFKVENSLTDFIAARAVDGMYELVAQEEAKIRTNINERTTDLMRRVFGYADEQLKLQSQSGGTGGSIRF